MPLTVLKPGQEFLEFEVFCTGFSRPPLSTHSSFSSTCSSSTAYSSSSSATYPPSSYSTRKNGYKPMLTQDDFLKHAFGSSFRIQGPTSPPLTACHSFSLPSSDCSPPPSNLLRTSTSSHHRRASIPTTYEPRGTFCSALKPPKIKIKDKIKDENVLIPPSAFKLPPRDSKLPLTELNAYEQTLNRSSSLSTGMNSPKWNQWPEHEPMMTNSQWREKSEDRLEARKLRRIKFALEGLSINDRQLPLDIDCRPVEGSMGLSGPSSDLPRAWGKGVRTNMRTRNLSVPASEMSFVVSEEQETQDELLDRKEKDAIKAALEKSRSMVELNRLDDLAKGFRI
ncbi:hypothetical protein DFH11DRAFT_1727318 [Phellopilus nigrolimitatus]|nr:hypothetical protein DFH11DRAFT_1727318 [Phellopilus nigrolimitatus]